MNSKKLGIEKRKYRKYTPWIFFMTEVILMLEIMYMANLLIGIEEILLVVFLGVFYFRFEKLFKVLDRQKSLQRVAYRVSVR